MLKSDTDKNPNETFKRKKKIFPNLAPAQSDSKLWNDR